MTGRDSLEPLVPEGDNAVHARRLGFWVGAVVTALVAALYLATFCRTVFWYDSAEYATAAAVLGIPHPPGYPLYTLIAHVFTWLPMEPAAAVNLMSAVFGVAAVTLAYAILRTIGVTVAAAALGALTLATARVFWFQAVIAEVYMPALAFLGAVMLLVLRGLQRDSGRLLVLAAALAGVGLGVHLFIATAGLGLGLLVLSLGVEPRSLRAVFGRDALRRRLLIAGLAAVAAGGAAALVFAWLPLRASMDPPLNWGDPSSWDRFSWVISGGNYKGWFGDVDSIERMTELAALFYGELTIAGLLLAAGGAAWLLRWRPIVGLAFLLVIGGNAYVFFDYRVHDLEVFFLPTLWVLCLMVGVGAHALLEALERLVQPTRRILISRAVIGALFLLPLAFAARSYPEVNMRDFTEAQDWADRLVAELPEGALIIDFTSPPEWKANAVFGFYYQIALGARPDVQVLTPQRPIEIVRALKEGRPVYLYHPMEPILRQFTLEPELGLYRVTGARPRS